jgi:hypothetical protein
VPSPAASTTVRLDRAVIAVLFCEALRSCIVIKGFPCHEKGIFLVGGASPLDAKAGDYGRRKVEPLSSFSLLGAASTKITLVFAGTWV